MYVLVWYDKNELAWSVVDRFRTFAEASSAMADQAREFPEVTVMVVSVLTFSAPATSRSGESKRVTTINMAELAEDIERRAERGE